MKVRLLIGQNDLMRPYNHWCRFRYLHSVGQCACLEFQHKLCTIECEETFRGGTWSEDNEGGATSFI